MQNAKHVILSAGALHSPKVLELSGVGDPSVLDKYESVTVSDCILTEFALA